MIPLLEEILRTKTVHASDGRSFTLHSATSVENAEVLQRLIAQKRPSDSVEVGLAFGVSALFICEALAKVGGRRHTVIDPRQSSVWNGVGLHNLDQCGFGELVNFRGQESQIALPQMVEAGERVDFAFIDGLHMFDHVLVDFFYIDRLLRPGGVVVFDDANWPGVHRVCWYVAINRSYRVCASAGPAQSSGIGNRALQWIGKRSQKARSILQARFTQPDEQFGFVWNSSLVAFEKLAEDGRHWDFDREF